MFAPVWNRLGLILLLFLSSFAIGCSSSEKEQEKQPAEQQHVYDMDIKTDADENKSGD